MDRWSNRVAVVSGASEGIGEAIVRRLAAEGMKVVALARREEMLKKLEEEMIEKKLYLRGHVCDVSKDDQVQSAFNWIEENVGPVSVLVNNAGVYRVIPVPEMDISTMKTIVDTNLTGLLETTIHGLRSMKKNNIDDGHIFNINSILGHRVRGNKGDSVYSATKHAVTVINETLKAELGEKKSKIRVTSISPGTVRTTMAKDVIAKRPGMGFLEPEDVVDSVMFALSSPANVNISEITIDPV